MCIIAVLPGMTGEMTFYLGVALKAVLGWVSVAKRTKKKGKHTVLANSEYASSFVPSSS